jgi:hypothetical protein
MKELFMGVGWFVVGAGLVYGYFYHTQQQVVTTSIPTNENELDIDYSFDDSLTSIEYARLGDKAWSAFECTALSSFLENDVSNTEKLFTVGYESGLTFIEALRKELVTDEDLQKEVPIGLSWQLGGPNSDFMLGKIYTTVEDNVLEDVFQDGDNFNSKEVQLNIAESKYNRANCNLLL